MIAEGILTPDMVPYIFQTEGFESKVGRGVKSTKTNKYGIPQALSTPEKTQRFSSQCKKR